ncbi:phenylalanine--tRNA ligase subunit alpha [Candidatus Uhrbacteria bacterium]|nr:phenylalanine--tRNA ligase subunit alpha [Candidatus Uhrbacteria bacterium]
MHQKFDELKKAFDAALSAAQDKDILESVRTEFLGRKGRLADLMTGLKDLSEDERRAVGPSANEAKRAMEEAFARAESELRSRAVREEEWIDVTAPVFPEESIGHIHPVTLIQQKLEDLFISMGFMVLDGPELESDYYNFTALNMPPDHPARDMQDTFYIKGHPDQVMRTQTSPVQIRAMRKYGAPIRMIAPGRCFRNEATDARHEHTFYQLEGLVIDKGITFSHMKGVMEAVAVHLFGPDTKLRLMPKFYPFVEPGVRGELNCFLCAGEGCRVCKNTGWLEAMPGGMVHPRVLEAGGLDPNTYQGFAFGFGLSRLAMLKYGIDDSRLMQSGDVRFLAQF